MAEPECDGGLSRLSQLIGGGLLPFELGRDGGGPLGGDLADED